MPKTLKDYVDHALTRVKEVDAKDVLTSSISHDHLILDVREPDEFAAGHIPGSLNYPRGFLEVRADLSHPKRDPVLADRNQAIICYCGGGHRSALAAETLLDMGFSHPTSMAGGWTEWVARGFPVELPVME